MPDPVQHVQSRHVARCVTDGTAGILHALCVKALNAQKANRGDVVGDTVIGCRVVSAASAFTVSNPDGTGTLTIQTIALPYDIPAVEGMRDTLVSAVALGVEVYYCPVGVTATP